MRRKSMWVAATCILALVGLRPVFSSGAASASKEKVLYAFTGGADGAYPESQLTLDSAGNLYGTTSGGGRAVTGCGDDGSGTVFELVRSQSGWKEQVLYTFGSYDGDGCGPQAGLTFDIAGNLYGTTLGGGGADGGGTVFKLTPNGKGEWTESILASGIGDFPSAVVIDASGNLYFTVSQGLSGGRSCNDFGCGGVFELSPQMDGSWQKTTVHVFQGAPENDGAWPQSGVLLDSAGNLYVATEYGGVNGCHSNQYNSDYPPTGCGGIYEFTNNSGTWTETTIYTFERGDGRAICPLGKPAFDHAGNLIGPTFLGGNGLGTFYELTPGKNGVWNQSVQYRFFGHGNGSRPLGNLTVGGEHRVYGVTSAISTKEEATAFELDDSVPRWKGKVLHTFSGGSDGLNPKAGMIMDRQGHLYGTTYQGGGGTGCYQPYAGCGTVYEVNP